MGSWDDLWGCHWSCVGWKIVSIEYLQSIQSNTERQPARVEHGSICRPEILQEIYRRHGGLYNHISTWQCMEKTETQTSEEVEETLGVVAAPGIGFYQLMHCSGRSESPGKQDLEA
jgi:hypothetical protein